MDQDVYRKVCHSSLFDHHLTAVPNEEEMEDKTELLVSSVLHCR